ncbi:MAG: DUF4469 domain-containing protein [Tannerella sp.]|jgi:hypothetical protein|nr:DUF4469 domain-containing protein [Tannerella sp.]
MSTIKAIAHLNELTKDVKNDYYLRPDTLDTLHDEDIILRLKKKEIATENVNGLAFVRQFHRECALAVSEGHNVVTGFVHAGIGFNGVVLAGDLGHNVPADQVKTHIAMTQGEYAREAIKDITVSVAEQPAPIGPVVQHVTNPVTGLADTLNTGSMALIQGMRLAVRGEKEKEDEIGVFFTTNDEKATTVRIPAGQLSPNTPTKLQFVLPSGVTPGEWRVKVATQSTANTGKYTKDVREYEYPNIVTVI